MPKGKPAIHYVPGLFNEFMTEDNYELWRRFPDIMWGMGYEMDCCKSFEEYLKHMKKKIHSLDESREGRRYILYLLERADRQIVGNYLFSVWRYYTHWAMSGDPYITDFLRRMIVILERKRRS